MFLGHDDIDTPRTPETEPNEQKQTTRTKSEQRLVQRSLLKTWENIKNIVKEKGAAWNQKVPKVSQSVNKMHQQICEAEARDWGGWRFV